MSIIAVLSIVNTICYVLAVKNHVMQWTFKLIFSDPRVCYYLNFIVIRTNINDASLHTI